MSIFSGYFQALLERIGEMRPRNVAISIHYRHQVLPAFELAGLLRRRLPAAKVLGGGGMLTSWRKTLRREGARFSPFHAIGFGPGEEALASVAAAGLADGEPFLEGGEAVEFVPEYGFAPLPEYLSPEPVLPVASSRGCYWRKCAFCPEAVAPTHSFRGADAASFPALLRELSLRHGVSRFHLTDNAIPPAVLRSMADRKDALRGISWHGFARFGRELLDPGFVSDLAEAGCSMLQLGLESGSQELLDRMGKGTRVEEASAILKNLSRAGISSYVYVMLGFPGETRDDAERTRSFLSDHAGEIGWLNLAILNLPRDAAWPGIGGGGRRLRNPRSPAGRSRWDCTGRCRRAAGGGGRRRAVSCKRSFWGTRRSGRSPGGPLPGSRRATPSSSVPSAGRAGAKRRRGRVRKRRAPGSCAGSSIDARRSRGRTLPPRR